LASLTVFAFLLRTNDIFRYSELFLLVESVARLRGDSAFLHCFCLSILYAMAATVAATTFCYLATAATQLSLLCAGICNRAGGHDSLSPGCGVLGRAERFRVASLACCPALVCCNRWLFTHGLGVLLV